MKKCSNLEWLDDFKEGYYLSATLGSDKIKKTILHVIKNELLLLVLKFITQNPYCSQTDIVKYVESLKIKKKKPGYAIISFDEIKAASKKHRSARNYLGKLEPFIKKVTAVGLSAHVRYVARPLASKVIEIAEKYRELISILEEEGISNILNLLKDIERIPFDPILSNIRALSKKNFEMEYELPRKHYIPEIILEKFISEFVGTYFENVPLLKRVLIGKVPFKNCPTHCMYTKKECKTENSNKERFEKISCKFCNDDERNCPQSYQADCPALLNILSVFDIVFEEYFLFTIDSEGRLIEEPNTNINQGFDCELTIEFFTLPKSQDLSKVI